MKKPVDKSFDMCRNWHHGERRKNLDSTHIVALKKCFRKQGFDHDTEVNTIETIDSLKRDYSRFHAKSFNYLQNRS
jgi:hypothetical protein